MNENFIVKCFEFNNNTLVYDDKIGSYHLLKGKKKDVIRNIATKYPKLDKLQQTDCAFLLSNGLAKTSYANNYDSKFIDITEKYSHVIIDFKMNDYNNTFNDILLDLLSNDLILYTTIQNFESMLPEEFKIFYEFITLHTYNIQLNITDIDVLKNNAWDFIIDYPNKSFICNDCSLINIIGNIGFTSVQLMLQHVDIAQMAEAIILMETKNISYIVHSYNNMYPYCLKEDINNHEFQGFTSPCHASKFN